jgi:hypothetical protein
MADTEFLTAAEVSARYQRKNYGRYSPELACDADRPYLRQDRKARSLSVKELDPWDQKNIVICRASRPSRMTEREWT